MDYTLASMLAKGLSDIAAGMKACGTSLEMGLKHIGDSLVAAAATSEYIKYGVLVRVENGALGRVHVDALPMREHTHARE